MLTEEQIYGIYVPVVTPFHAAGELDLESYQRYVNNIIKNNIHGLVVNGTTGESPTVNIQELQSLVDTSRELLKSSSIPLVVGTGTNDTYSTVARTELAANAGADAALVVVPYYSRPSQEGIIAHFRKAAEVGLPIMAYDIPGRTGVGMTLDTARTILEMNNVVGLKTAPAPPARLRAVQERRQARALRRRSAFLRHAGLRGRRRHAGLSQCTYRPLPQHLRAVQSRSD